MQRRNHRKRRAVVNVTSVRQLIRCGTDSFTVVAWRYTALSPVSLEQQDCSTMTVGSSERQWSCQWRRQDLLRGGAKLEIMS